MKTHPGYFLYIGDYIYIYSVGVKNYIHLSNEKTCNLRYIGDFTTQLYRHYI